MRKPNKEIQLTSYNDLLGIDELHADKDCVVEVSLDELYPFKDHPFRVQDDEKMAETVESIRHYGVLNPGLVRRRAEGGYELIAGHRRKHGSELAGKITMPVLIRDYTDDEAIIVMVDSNIQREDILPSEKAKAYKMKYEAMKHQGSKGEKFTADAVGEAAGESGRTVQRYIRLAELVQELLDDVDSKKISMVVGETLSYLKKEEQTWLVAAVTDCGIFPSKVQAEQLKERSKNGELTESRIYAILVKKEVKNSGVILPAKKVRSYFPHTYTKNQIEEVIYMLLEQWKQDIGKEGEFHEEDTV